MNTTTKLHHTVPRFYLNGFADNGRLQTVVAREPRRSFQQSVSQASAENHFYSVAAHPDGPDVFEKVFARLESRAAGVLRQVVDGGQWPLPPAERDVLVEFMTFQFLRGRDQRDQMADLHRSAAELVMRMTRPEHIIAQAAQRGESLSLDEANVILQRLQADGAIEVDIPASMHIQQIGQLLPKLRAYLSGRPWRLVTFQYRALVTADRPLTLIPAPRSDPHLPVGLMTAWSLIFPLDRRHGLIMFPPDELAEIGITVEEVQAGSFDTAGNGTAKLERFFNHFTAANADRWIFHHPDDRTFVPANFAS